MVATFHLSVRCPRARPVAMHLMVKAAAAEGKRLPVLACRPQEALEKLLVLAALRSRSSPTSNSQAVQT